MGTGEPVVMESAELVIADFDGTLVDLPIDWMALRERLAVRSIDQLFAEGRHDDWVTVRNAVIVQINDQAEWILGEEIDDLELETVGPLGPGEKVVTCADLVGS